MGKREGLELCVAVDVGCYGHHAAVGLSSGEFLESFEVAHQPAGFQAFFSRLAAHQARYGCPVSVAMEAYNGYARPLDSLVLLHNYRLYNINNLKLARFKEVFPGAAKTDALDARKALELFQLREHLPLAKQVLQEVGKTPEENRILKRLTRRRRRLVDEKTRVLNNLQSDLQAVCPNLLAITKNAANLWFLRFLVSTDSLPKLARVRRQSLLKVPSIGVKYASLIQAWQKEAEFSDEVEWVGEMIQDDAARVLELYDKIKQLEAKMAEISARSEIATLLASIPGFALVCTSELAGEIATLERFQSEASLSLYLGMANLDDRSGTKVGSKPPKQVNTRAKAAMMIAVDRHRKQVPASQRYYEKKRAEGKGHNQAVRALGRHLCRVIFKMLRDNRPYELRK